MADVRDHWVRKTAYMLGKALAYRQDGRHQEYFTDILYEDLVSDSMGQLKAIYDSYEGISNTLAESFHTAERENPKGKYGVHDYRLSDFGLSREDIVAKNRDYYKLYESLR